MNLDLGRAHNHPVLAVEDPPRVCVEIGERGVDVQAPPPATTPPRQDQARKTGDGQICHRSRSRTFGLTDTISDRVVVHPHVCDDRPVDPGLAELLFAGARATALASIDVMGGEIGIGR